MSENIIQLNENLIKTELKLGVIWNNLIMKRRSILMQ